MSEDQAPASDEPQPAVTNSASEPQPEEIGSTVANLQQENSMAQEVATDKEVPMSPVAPKPALPKPIEAVYYEPEAYASLLSFSAGIRPAIGILHGSFLDQGIALINRISLLPRSIDSLRAWKVVPFKDVDMGGIFDGIGVICFESNEAVLSYAVEEAKALLPIKNHWLSVHSSMFINDEDVLVIKVMCNLHATESKADPKPLPMYQIPEISVGKTNVNETFASELQQSKTVLQDKLSNFMRIQSQLLVAEHSMNQRLQVDTMRTNELARFDQSLLGLKRAIHRRISDLEKVWAAKKSRSEGKETNSGSESGKPQDNRFVNLIAQLANRDLPGSHTSLHEMRPNKQVIPDRFESIFIRTTRSSQPSTKKKPAAPKPKVPKPPVTEAPSTVSTKAETIAAITTHPSTEINVTVDETAIV